MTTAAEQTARVDALAEAVRSSTRAKPLGPRRRIVATRIEVLDLLECGHSIPSRRGGEIRCCPFCPRFT